MFYSFSDTMVLWLNALITLRSPELLFKFSFSVFDASSVLCLKVRPFTIFEKTRLMLCHHT